MITRGGRGVKVKSITACQTPDKRRPCSYPLCYHSLHESRSSRSAAPRHASPSTPYALRLTPHAPHSHPAAFSPHLFTRLRAHFFISTGCHADGDAPAHADPLADSTPFAHPLAHACAACPHRGCRRGPVPARLEPLPPPPPPPPSPPPVPPARIEAADEAMFAGDWSRALAEYQAVLEQTDASGPSGPLGQTKASAPLRPAAQLELGKARLNGGDAPGAINELAAFLQQHPDSPQAADANFLLGEAYRATGAWVQAVEAYRAYQQLRPGTIDSYVEERIGQSASFNQDYRTAEQA